MTDAREILVERLAAHRTLGDSPRSELEWLASHGELRRFFAGEVLASKGEIPHWMIIMLSGHGAVYIDRGSGRRKVMDWGTGDITGVLPFSRLRVAIGDAVMDQESDTLLVRRELFAEMIRECPTVTERVVHTMLDRVRHFASTDWQDDKMMSLGRLAAGLSHELNNPASAAERSAQVLADALSRVSDAAIALARAQFSDDEYEFLAAFAARAQIRCATDAASAIERADREEVIAEWLVDAGEDGASAGTLAEAGFDVGMLEELANAIPAGKIGVALRWVTTGYVARTLAADVERAAHRIYELVSAVKRFTYMDRATVAEPTNLGQALADTVAVLASKAKSKAVSVAVDIPAELPLVNAFGGELNQVWSNVLENALDAVPASGHVAVTAKADAGNVIVRVVDDGPGIPAEHMTHIFDPFFTTKPVGQGTGLGLDIARRIVRRHDGQIEVQSRPGHTEFRIELPIQPR